MKKKTDRSRIVTDPKVLSTISEEVLIGTDVSERAKEMLTAMSDAGGVGIAAIQLGYPERIIYVQGLLLINPEIIERARGLKQSTEGCLSVPNKVVTKMRLSKVTVKYWDANWEEKTKVFRGLPCMIVQHEIDHLNGITI